MLHIFCGKIITIKQETTFISCRLMFAELSNKKKRENITKRKKNGNKKFLCTLRGSCKTQIHTRASSSPLITSTSSNKGES